METIKTPVDVTIYAVCICFFSEICGELSAKKKEIMEKNIVQKLDRLLVLYTP